jgi:hypothetical protein
MERPKLRCEHRNNKSKNATDSTDSHKLKSVKSVALFEISIQFKF